LVCVTCKSKLRRVISMSSDMKLSTWILL